MEEKLSKLFDYQRIAGNSRIQAMTDAVSQKYLKGGSITALSDDDMGLVNAAGVPEIMGYRDDSDED
ncbi:MAG: hypothetical protein K5886_00490 [Lachnospiraceae bacterium]|nr:hypothetical protein [Lachnospiraceae bacterium]